MKLQSELLNEKIAVKTDEIIKLSAARKEAAMNEDFDEVAKLHNSISDLQKQIVAINGELAEAAPIDSVLSCIHGTKNLSNLVSELPNKEICVRLSIDELGKLDIKMLESHSLSKRLTTTTSEGQTSTSVKAKKRTMYIDGVKVSSINALCREHGAKDGMNADVAKTFLEGKGFSNITLVVE